MKIPRPIKINPIQIPRPIEIVRVPTVKRFNGILFQALVNGINYKSTNRKEAAYLALQRGAAWVEVTLYPETMGGEKPINTAEGIVCDNDCAHNALNAKQSGAGRCYVNAINIASAQRKALTQTDNETQFTSLIKGGFILRLTRWGDISRLNNEGLAWALTLCESAAETRAYSNLWRSETAVLAVGDLERYGLIQSLKAYCQASVSTADEALAAARRGWKVYAGARQDEIRAALIHTGFNPVFRCPYRGEAGGVFCSNCPTPCNATRHILSPREST